MSVITNNNIYYIMLRTNKDTRRGKTTRRSLPTSCSAAKGMATSSIAYETHVDYDYLYGSEKAVRHMIRTKIRLPNV